jgi:hypothetical protein
MNAQNSTFQYLERYVACGKKSEAESADVEIGRDGVCGCNRPENDVQIGRDGVLGAWD